MPRLVLGLFLVLLAPASVLGEAPPAVTIRVVDLAEVGPEPLLLSLDVTEALFDAVGIAVSWRHCRDEVDDCSDPLLPHEVWLRVAPGNAERALYWHGTAGPIAGSPHKRWVSLT